jgi:hypothetical protein
MPQAIAAAIVYIAPTAGATAFTVAATAVSYATVIGYALTITAAIAYGASQSAKLRNAGRGVGFDSGRSVMARDAIGPRRIIYGELPVSGTIVFMHTYGAKNEYLWVVVAIAGREVDSLGEVVFDGGEVVPLDVNGDATGKYAGYFHLDKFTGAPGQNANANMVADIPTMWTSFHKLSGIAHFDMRFKYSPDLFPNGIPTVTVKTKGCKVYDPRDGAQSATNPATWVWSANAALCAIDYIRDAEFGRGVPASRVNMASVIEAANICDETVILDVGSEKRYETHGTALSNQDSKEVLVDMIASMAGRFSDVGGIWSVSAGAYRTATVPAFTDDDLVGAFTVQPRQSMRETYSGCKGTFISPLNKWAPADFVPHKNDTYMAQDGGKRRWQDVNFGFVISSAQAQRLAKISVERGRQQIIITGLYMLKSFPVMPTDTIQITRAALGWVAKEFEVLKWTFRLLTSATSITLAVELTARETAPGVWDWANGEETAVDLAPNTNLPDPSVVAVPTGLAVLTDSSTANNNTGNYLPRARVTWNTPNDIYVEQGGKYRLEYKKSADATWILWTEGRGDILLDFITDVQIGTNYDFRLQFQNQTGARSNVAGVPAYATVTNYPIAGDNLAPAAVGSLVAVTGTGKVVSLDWDDSTEPDLGEYEVQRSPAGAGTWAKIAEIRSSRFVDVDVVIGTPYDYRVRAIDRSENPGGWSLTVTATPGTVSAGSVDPTPPVDPINPTFSSSTTYLSGDGTVLAKIAINVPIFTTRTAVMNLLYRKSGAAGWIVADQRSVGGGTSDIDDLTPGVAYDVAIQAFSAFGVGSNIIAATGSPFTAPNKTTGPAAPGGVSYVAGGSTSFDRPAPLRGANSLFCFRVNWNATDLDTAFYEWALTSVDSDAAADVAFHNRVDTLEAIVSNGIPVSSFFRVRGVNNTGIRGAWGGGGVNINGSGLWGVAGGTMMSQNASSVSITGGTIAGITDIAVADGGTGASTAAGARAALGIDAPTLGVRRVSHVEVLVGGAASETFTYTHGIGTLQSYPTIQCVSPAGDVNAFHDFASAGNDANNSVFTVFDPVGGVIAAGARRFTIHFIE